MALRDFAVGAARLNATVWKEIVRAVDPQPDAGSGASRPAVRAPNADEPAATTNHDVPADGAPVSTPGTMLVPLDTWTRVLDQLGHLHQAGQELAEARERAAKAETEATFLREQLAEARAQLKPTPKRAAPRPKPKPTGPPAPEISADDLAMPAAQSAHVSAPPGVGPATVRVLAVRDAAWGSVSRARSRIRNRRGT